MALSGKPHKNINAVCGRYAGFFLKVQYVVCVVKCVLGRITGFAWSVIKLAEGLYQGCTNFPKTYEPPQISRRPKGDRKLFPQMLGDTVKIGRFGDLEHGICARLVQICCKKYVVQKVRLR
jgi:hypothetical protein